MRADSPLGLEVQSILAEHSDGLKKAVLLKRLREQNPFAQESHLDEILANRDTFVERPGNIWVLARLLTPGEALERPEDTEQAVVSTLPDSLPMSDLPLDLSSYVVFDLETTGFDPATDGIIQFAALKVVDGRPTEGCNCFVRPVKPLPLSLQQKLGLDTNPEKLAEIQNAPPIEEQINGFREFLGDLPLVAHNARFDYKFLAQAYKVHLGCELEDLVIDTMELSLLALPDSEGRKLEGLAKKLGISHEAVETAVPEMIFDQMDLDLSGESFHDAGFDIIYLYLVFQALHARLNDLPNYLLSEMLRLLPRDRYILSPLVKPEIVPATEPVPLEDLGVKVPPADSPPTEPVDFSPEEIEDLFVHGGKIQQGMAEIKRRAGEGDEPDFEERPRQQEMVRLVAERLAEEDAMMVEAPTGTGKTLAYLVPAIFWARSQGKQVAVSTSVKNLQDQLVKELDRLQQISPDTFRYQVLKGRANYVSPSAWDALRSQLDEDFPSSGDRYRVLTDYLEVAPRGEDLERFKSTYLEN